jgi:hypothetical protein
MLCAERDVACRYVVSVLRPVPMMPFVRKARRCRPATERHCCGGGEIGVNARCSQRSARKPI